MKRRDFLSTPLAMAALGAGTIVPALARAAVTRLPLSSAFVLMRLDGSAGTKADETRIDSVWQTTWSTASGAKSARLSFYGLVRGRSSTLSQLNVDAQYLAANNAINSVTVYTGGSTPLGDRSKPVSMDVTSAGFVGFALSSVSTDSKGVNTLGTCAIANGLPMAPGVYALMLPAGGQRVVPTDYQFSTYLDRPLMRRDGALPDIDYLAFVITATR